MAALINRSGNYRVQWRFNGEWQSATFPDEKLAKAAKALVDSLGNKITDTEVYQRVGGVELTKPSDGSPRFRAWADTWLGRKSDISRDTLVEYRYLLCSKRVMDRLGDLHLKEIADDPGIIKDLIAACIVEGLSPATVRKLHAVLHQVFRDAIPKWIGTNPCSKLPGHRTKGLPKVKRCAAVYLSPAEADMILAACHENIRDLIEFDFKTGLRLGELLALIVRDAEMSRKPRRIHVSRARKKSGAVGDPKSEAGIRPVDLSESAGKIIESRVAGKPPTALIFPAPEGGMWDPRNLRERYWKPALIRAARCPTHPPLPQAQPTPLGADPDLLCGDYGGKRSDGKLCRAVVEPGLNRCRWHKGVHRDAISTCDCPTRLHLERVRIHDGRHSYVDWCLTAGWDLLAVQLQIGHESPSTTLEMYGNRQRRPDQRRLDAFDEVLASGSGSGAAA